MQGANPGRKDRKHWVRAQQVVVSSAVSGAKSRPQVGRNIPARICRTTWLRRALWSEAVERTQITFSGLQCLSTKNSLGTQWLVWTKLLVHVAMRNALEPISIRKLDSIRQLDGCVQKPALIRKLEVMFGNGDGCIRKLDGCIRKLDGCVGKLIFRNCKVRLGFFVFDAMTPIGVVGRRTTRAPNG